MINLVKITNHLGEVLSIDLRSPEQSGFFIRSIDGLGPTKTNINIVESLSIDGGVYNSSRNTTRNIVFNLGFHNVLNKSIETLRQETYRFFSLKQPITIEIQTDNRTGITNGYVETNEPDIFSKDPGTIISLICPFPYFFEEEVVETFFSGMESNFEFPFENPSLTLNLIEFGLVYIDDQKSLIYTGDEETGVIITIHFLGSVDDPLYIYNFTKNQAMELITSAMTNLPTTHHPIVGDVLTISTLKGAKNITLNRNGVNYNVINSLGDFKDWFTIQKGDNVFGYSVSSGQEYVQMSIQHQVIYGGL